MTKRPNFLFVITDQQWADYLACTGHPVLKTPNIDRIAEGGSIFSLLRGDGAYAQPRVSDDRAHVVGHRGVAKRQ